jgi:superfamily II DNA or RNA helicase
MKNADFRYGCTGTLSDDEIDVMNVRSYIGPVFKEYSTKYLKERGYLVECQINQISLHYEKKFKGDFFEVKDKIFKNEFRMDVIKNCLTRINDNLALMLVNKVEDEGQYFLDYLRKFKEFDDIEIIFLSGRTKKDDREF